jgi:hypothetical protein
MITKSSALAAIALLLAPWHGAQAAPVKPDKELPEVPPGFTITLFARDPLVRHPCSMAFDARGRLFVGMGPQFRMPRPDTPGDSVVIVLDTDGDGVTGPGEGFRHRLQLYSGPRLARPRPVGGQCTRPDHRP